MLLYVIGLLMIGAAIYMFIRGIGTPKKNYDARTRIIEEKVTALGGTIENIQTSKSDHYPYIHEIDQNDGSYHVYYKITYRLEDETKEGWAVLKLQQSLVGPVGAATNEWIWKLE